MTLDDIRRLNFRDAGNWPLLPKIAVLGLLVLLILAAGAFFDWKDQLDALTARRMRKRSSAFRTPKRRPRRSTSSSMFSSSRRSSRRSARCSSNCRTRVKWTRC
jgi:Tfp pilus assembly protein PilO